MSWSWYECECPICGNDADFYQDSKPFDYITAECMNCWWTMDVTFWRETLDGFKDELEFSGLVDGEKELQERVDEYNKHNGKDFTNPR